MQNGRINFTFRLFVLNNYYKFVANRGSMGYDLFLNGWEE